MLGVPMERLRGVEAMFEQALRFAPELSFMALTRGLEKSHAAVACPRPT